MQRLTLLLLITATLAVTGCEPIDPPIITVSPVGETANAGQVVIFKVEAEGEGKLAYQWLKNGAEIPGNAAERAFYISPELSPGDDGARFSCVVRNKGGAVTSAEATVTVTTDVAITSHEATTGDGWTIGLRRYRPDALNPAYEPILMCHGFLESGRVYDLDNRRSLAMTLARRGFEVWTMDLRGSGLSAGPDVGQLLDWDWNIDDFIHQDAPAAIDHVLATSGKSRLFWVGHSMGGLIGYAYCQTHDASKIKGLVTLAGAGWMGGLDQFEEPPGGLFMALGVLLGNFLLPDFTFPVGWLWENGPGSAPWAKLIHEFLLTDFGRFTWSTDNMDPASIQLLLDRGVDNTSMNMVRQFLDWTRDEDIYTYGPTPYEDSDRTSAWFDANGYWSYKDHLGDVLVPALVLGGQADQVIPDGNVERVFEALGSADKTLRIFGTDHGDPVDVGHEDILGGTRTPALVYPVVTEWLEARAGQ